MRRFFRRSPAKSGTNATAPSPLRKERTARAAADVTALSVKQLKAIITQAGLSFEGCVEKSELRKIAQEAQVLLAKPETADQKQVREDLETATSILLGKDVADCDVPLPRSYADFAEGKIEPVVRKVPGNRRPGSALDSNKVFISVAFDTTTGAIDVAPLKVCRIDALGSPGEDDLATQLDAALRRGRGSFEDQRRKAKEQVRLDAMYGENRMPLQTQSADRGRGKRRENRRQSTGNQRPGTAALDSGRPSRINIGDQAALPRTDSFGLPRSPSFRGSLKRQDSSSSIDFSATSPKMKRLDSSSSLGSPLFGGSKDGFWPAGDHDFPDDEDEEKMRRAKKKFYAKEAENRGRYEKRDKVEAEAEARRERAELREKAARRREAERAADRARAAQAERRPPPPELGAPPSDIPLQYRTPERSRPLPRECHPSKTPLTREKTPPVQTANVCLPEDRRVDLDGLAAKPGPIAYHDIKWLEMDLGWRSLGTQRGAPAERRRKLCQRELGRWHPDRFEALFGARVAAGPDALRILTKVEEISMFLTGLLGEVPERPRGRPPSPRYEEPALTRAQGVDVRR